jgi:DNA-binding CsgD family transcriptional regulator
MRENDGVSRNDLAGQAAVLDRWFQAFNDHDIDALCQIADPAVEVVPLKGSKTVPPGARFHGREGLRSLLTASFERFPRMRIRHTDPQPIGNEVSVQIEFMLDDGVEPPTVRSATCDYRIADGLIRRMRAFDRDRGPVNRPDRPRSTLLSPREREVLALLAGGQTVQEIAEELSLSPLTIRTHVRNAKDKLSAKTTAHAVAIALDEDALNR